MADLSLLALRDQTSSPCSYRFSSVWVGIAKAAGVVWGWSLRLVKW